MTKGPETKEAESPQHDQDKSAPKGMTLAQFRALQERFRKLNHWILCGQVSDSNEPEYLTDEEWEWELQKRFGDGTHEEPE